MNKLDYSVHSQVESGGFSCLLNLEPAVTLTLSRFLIFLRLSDSHIWMSSVTPDRSDCWHLGEKHKEGGWWR